MKDKTISVDDQLAELRNQISKIRMDIRAYAPVRDTDLEPKVKWIRCGGLGYTGNPKEEIKIITVVNLLLEYLGLELGATTINDEKEIYLVEEAD